ncbi:MAG TPA: DJ-1/PfpI family protein, partial [Burkholderiaceae bacterium]|nr:DJ-1/PfpI family protein [Burkholderiaceae bacterium]
MSTPDGDCDDPKVGASDLAGKDAEAADPASEIVVVAFDGVEAIDIGAAASVFSKAAQLHPGRYSLQIASPDGGTVITNSGLSIADTRALKEFPDAIDTVIVAGGETSGAVVQALGVR